MLLGLVLGLQSRLGPMQGVYAV